MKKVAIVIAVVLSASVQNANATLTFDLRTSSGGNYIELAPGSSGTLSLELWGIVTGSNSINTDDGIQYAYAWLVTDNHGITGLTGFSATTSRAYGFTGTPNTEGTLVANGGINDLKGSAKTNTWSVKTTAGTNIPPVTENWNIPGLPAADWIGLSNGDEFKLATFSYSYSNLQFSEGHYAIINCAIPTWASVVYRTASWSEDTTTSASKSASNSTTVGIGDGVMIGVPEPSALILFGMGCLTLLAWRRRKRL